VEKKKGKGIFFINGMKEGPVSKRVGAGEVRALREGGKGGGSISHVN